MRNYALEAEQQVIGSLILISDVTSPLVQRTLDTLNADDFVGTTNRTLFRAVCDFVDSGESYDMFLLAERTGIDLADVIELQSEVAGASNLTAYAKIVKERATERTATATLMDAMDRLRHGEGTVAERIALVEDALNGLNTLNSSGSHLVGMKEALKEFINDLEYRYENPGATGLTTGIKALDARFQGFKPGELVIIAARPAMGKTSVSTNFALHVGETEQVLFFSLEMPRKQLVQRMVAAAGAVDLSLLKTGAALHEQADQVQLGTRIVHNCNLKIDDTPALDVAELRSRARMAARKGPVGMIVVDYLQLLNDRTERDRFQAVSSISRKLKALAKELNCVVVALSQLSRKCEERTDKRPINSDLRESGQLEQDADAIIMLYRDEVYDEGSSQKGVIELITTKFRDGEIGTDYAAFIGKHNRITDLAFRPEEPPKQTSRRGFLN